jgi:hypothetical protein
MIKTLSILVGLTLALVEVRPAPAQSAPRVVHAPSAADYPSIQAALRANPGRMVYVPAGDYEIAEKILLTHERSGLYGPGRIIQTNSEASIIEIVRAADVQIRDLTLTRPEGRMETNAEAVEAVQCRDLVLENLRVVDNHSSRAAIALHACDGGQVRNCLVRNYHRIAIDDRTKMPYYGYAFNCIAGFGIETEHGSRVLIQGNRVIEERLLPTPAMKEKYRLGQFVKKNPVKGTLMTQKFWDGEYAQNWQQGSAIVVNAPQDSADIQVLGNFIENAGQGMDIHADRVVVAQNIVNNAHIGMKAMHGSRHVLILGNQFIKTDLWSIGLMPGTASHAARPARAGQPAQADNGDGGSIIANNIISEFGYGDSHWVWGSDNAPIKFDSSPLPDAPPLGEVIIQGNMVYDTGRDQIIVDGKPKTEPPRYKHAVRVSRDAKGLHFSNNLFHPGTAGVSNIELRP